MGDEVSPSPGLPAGRLRLPHLPGNSATSLQPGAGSASRAARGGSCGGRGEGTLCAKQKLAHGALLRSPWSAASRGSEFLIPQGIQVEDLVSEMQRQSCIS